MDPIYLDHAATTPMRDEVRDAMAPCLGDAFGNPSSTHRWGRRAAAHLDAARREAAEALGAKPAEIFFTRGGTESDNLALAGRCLALRGAGDRPTLAVTSVEHPAVLDAARKLATDGVAELRVLGVDPAGGLSEEALDAALSEPHPVVSVMWVNNETGGVFPIAELAERVRAAGGTLHSDAVQAVGKVPVDVSEVAIDLLTVTGHKIYGPKGSGLLFVRANCDVAPILHGGGQERGLRPGTEDVAGAVGLARAIRLAVDEQAQEALRLAALRDRLEERLRATIPDLRVHFGDGERAPHVSSVGIEGVAGDAVLMAMDLEGVAVSGGSACASGSGKGSHVIAALYGDDDRAATVRFSLGRGTTAGHVDRAADTLLQVIGRLQSLEAAS